MMTNSSDTAELYLITMARTGVLALGECNFREFQVGFKMYVIFGKCTVHASHESKYTPVWVPLVVLFHIHII